MFKYCIIVPKYPQSLIIIDAGTVLISLYANQIAVSEWSKGFFGNQCLKF
jgi:hypothetical protein